MENLNDFKIIGKTISWMNFNKRVGKDIKKEI